MEKSPVVELRVRSLQVAVGQVALVLIGAIGAGGLITVPTRGARVVGVIAALVLVAGVAWLMRALRRQAIVVDGDRLGYRNSPMGNVSGWTDLANVESATVAKLATSVRRTRPDMILWTPVGGLQGVSALMLRSQAPSSRTAGVRLNPFLLPFSSLCDIDRATLDALLSRHGIVG
jgi:hypothetical protein